MDLEYLRMCYNESLRIEAPISYSFYATVDREITIGGMKTIKPFSIKPGEGLAYVMPAVHHDPSEWPEHERYEPERFNTSDPNNKWLLNAEGKPRNTFAFAPFTGGKRVCLGKTFAEVTTKFTIPMLFHYLDFDFVDREKQTAHK
jgi:cytochrome P450